MAKVNIFNLDESINELITDKNKDDLFDIIEDFKNGSFQNVLEITTIFRNKHEITTELASTLALIEATSHAQVGDNEQAAKIVLEMYESPNEKSIDDLILFGNLAFMCDYRLSRRIMSDAVTRIENEQTFDTMKTAQAYVVLGEAEEKLEKFIRATRYFKRGLTYFMEEDKEANKQMTLYLHFKLGTLLSSLNEVEEAIEHLQQTIELTDENTQEVKVNSLVSIAKLYSSKDEFEKVTHYLQEAIPLIENSSLANRIIHAEAYSEMAYTYFQLTEYDKAAPYYEKAIVTYEQLPNHPHQELGIIFMQYAYTAIHKKESDISLAGKLYDRAYEQLAQVDNPVLLENALTDIILFFNNSKNKKQKKFYEEKLDDLMNEDSPMEMN